MSSLATEVPKVPLQDQLASTVIAMQKGGILYSEALTEFRKRFLTELILRCGGNTCRAAREAGVHRNTLARTCHELGIDVGKLRREAHGKGEQQQLRFQQNRKKHSARAAAPDRRQWA